MTTETLWITLPTNEENKIREIFNSIKNKNLTNISINQLIEKLENNQAADWLEVLGEYNSIPSINNIDTSQMLARARSVRNKFDRKNTKNQIIYPDLKNETFAPNQLLSLVILCYSNPNLIGPKLCKALNENDVAAIKHEILANSSYVRAQGRVVPWALNLRLANYALYANDTTVRLPVDVINRVKNETIQKGLTVHIVDQRGGFDEWVNGTERASRSERDVESKIDTYAILKSLQSDDQLDMVGDNYSRLDSPDFVPQINHAANEFDTPEVLHLNATSDAANSSNRNGLIIGSLALFYIAKNTPVGAVVRNIGKDLATAGQYVGSFFSKNNSEHTEEIEQKTALLSSVTKS